MGDVSLSSLAKSVPLGGLMDFPYTSPIVLEYAGMTFVRTDSYLSADQTALVGSLWERPTGVRIIASPVHYLANAGNTSTSVYAADTAVSTAFIYGWGAAVSGNMAIIAHGKSAEWLRVYTVDGGAKWFITATTAPGGSSYCACFHNGLAHLGGIDSSNFATIYRSDLVNNGPTLTLVQAVSGTTTYFRSIASSSPTSAGGALIGVGQSSLVRRFAGAATTSSTPTGVPGGNYNVVEHIDGVWYIGGDSGVFATSSDDGASFTSRAIGGNSGSATDIIKIGNEVHVFVSNNSTTRKTTDGGVTWSAGITLPATWATSSVVSNLGSVLVISSGSYFVFGQSRSGAYYSTNNGASWTADYLGPYGSTSQKYPIFAVGSRVFMAYSASSAVYEMNATNIIGMGEMIPRGMSNSNVASFSYMRVK